MSYKWFKLHHDMPDDIKLRRFTIQEKWAWVTLLCLASKSSTRGIIYADDDDISDYCEFNCTQDWLYYRDKLIAKGMLEINQDGNISILHWEDRQYDKPSDRPEAVRERVARSRAKKKEEKDKREESQSNAQVTPCNALQTRSNADVTPQTRLEEIRLDQNKEECILSNPVEPEQQAPSHEDLFAEFWKRYPKKKGKAKCKTRYRNLLDGGHIHSDILDYLEYDLTHEMKDREEQYIPLPYTWLNREDWTDSEWKEVAEKENDPLGHLQPWIKAVYEVLPRPEEWVRVLDLCGIRMEYLPPNDPDDHFATGVIVDHSDGGKPFVYWSAFSREYPPDLVKASLLAKGLSSPQWLADGEKAIYARV